MLVQQDSAEDSVSRILDTAVFRFIKIRHKKNFISFVPGPTAGSLSGRRVCTTPVATRNPVGRR
jgi:hypothetical protein